MIPTKTVEITPAVDNKVARVMVGHGTTVTYYIEFISQVMFRAVKPYQRIVTRLKRK